MGGARLRAPRHPPGRAGGRQSLLVASYHHGMDPAADVEVAGDLTPARGEGCHEIVEDPGRDRLVERSLVPVAPEVELEALQLHAGPVRHIDDADGGEIRLPGHRAY